MARADDATKTILTVYDSSMCRDTNKAVLSGSRFQASDLEACASFLNIDLRKDGTKIYSNKASLALCIILEIESFFPAICEDCSEEYSNPHDPLNPPILRCFLNFYVYKVPIIVNKLKSIQKTKIQLPQPLVMSSFAPTAMR